MELTGTPFTVTMTTAAIAAFVLAIWGMPRLVGSWPRAMMRIIALACVNVVVVMTVATHLNATNGWYSSWGDLVGAAPKQEEAQAGDAAKAASQKVEGAAQKHRVPTSFPPLPEPGQRKQTYTFKGPASGLTGEIVVVLPKSYEEPGSTKKYPVAEAFHGFPGTPSGWVSKMDAPKYLDEAVASGKIRETLLVVPAITIPRGVDSECVNGPSGKAQMETWVSEDVPRFVRDRFRVEQGRDSWAAMGYSVGGYCATLMGMHHSDTFGAVVSLGGYVKPDFATGAPWPAGSPLAARYDLVARIKEKVPPVAMYVQAGQRSPFWKDIKSFMDSAKDPMSLKSVVLLDTGHRWDVWQGEMPKVFAWMGSSIPGFRPQK
ncbi:alpha/beta hydrolase [Austwickia chelonae]|uniref:alpha/beta hydrolase n=1 Tax=Austwickia chelonae TaxID=100225 RepID=UPI0013C358FC|nr:alpha/beta hydrolase-fold protein [Austwickia chelonae]